LGACETGINENKPADELIGLTRSFIYTGTPSVLVGLWTVNAVSTLDLMIDFYKQLKNGNNKNKNNPSGDIITINNTRIDRVDIATALQAAQKNIIF
jgi:CHAT domain-containing protein